MTRRLLCLIAALSASTASAATAIWDTSTTADFQPGSGTWGTDTFWSNNGTTLGAWVSGDAAVFQGDGSAVTDTITLSSTQTHSGLTFGSAFTFGNWQFVGAGMTLSQNANFLVNEGSTAVIGNSIGGAFGFTKAGTGHLTLTGVSSYTGTTTVSAGTLTVSSGGNLGAGVVSVLTGANLELASAVTLTSLGGTGAVTIGNAATLTINRASTWFFFDGQLGGAGALVKSGAGEVLLRGDSSAFTGAITLQGGTLSALNATSSLGSGDLTITASAAIGGETGYTGYLNNRIFVTGGTATFGVAGKWADLVFAKDILATGTGSIVFTSNQLNVVERDVSVTGTGTLTLAKGTLQLGNGGTTGTINGGTTFNLATTGGTLAFKRSDDFTYSGVISGAAGFTQAGTGNLTLTGVNTYTGTTTVSAGTLTVAAGAAIGTGNVALSGGRLVMASLDVAKITATAGVFEGVLTGTGGLTKSGAGTVTLTGVNTYAGTTTVSAGNLTVSSGGSLGPGAVSVASGATLQLNAGSTVANLSGAGTIAIASAATLTVNPLSGWSFFNGGLSGSGKLVKSGAGETLLTGDSNAFTGAITLQGGTFSALNATSSLGSGDLTITASAAIGGETGYTGYLNNRIFVTGGTATFGVAGKYANLVFAKDILATGTGSIVFTSNQLNVVERDVSVTGTGTLTLAKGTLQLGNGGTTGTINGGTSFNLATTGGTLAFKRSDDFTYSGVISGAAGLTQAGAGNLTLTGVNTYTGATTVSAGTLTLAGSATFGSGAITLTGGLLNLGGRTITNTVTVNGGSLAGGSINLSQMTISSGTVSANLTGSASYTKAGAGAVTLSGNNTYTGSTVVNAGTLTAGSNNAFSTGNLTVNAGATLGVGAGVTLANNVTLSGATTILANGGILSGVLSGTGSMTKTGTGSLTLTGNNTFTGGTVVQSGTLRVDGVLAGTVTINTGGKLGGTGRMNGGVSVRTGGSVGAGGVAPSALTLAALELRNGASLELKIVDGAGSAGVGFDRYLVTGALDLSAASLTDRVTLRLSGLPTNFNAASNLTFTFLDYGSLNLGAASNITDLFAINTDNLFDQNGNALSSGSFSVLNDAITKQLSVVYTSPIPEPSTYGLGLGALGLAIAMVRRRRSRAK